MSDPILWNDSYTVEELETALDYHAAIVAKKTGLYEIADEMRAAAACIRDLAEERDRLLTQLAEASGALLGLDDVSRQIRAGLESLSKP